MDSSQSTGLAAPEHISDADVEWPEFPRYLRQLDGLHSEDPLIRDYWAKLVPVVHPDEDKNPEVLLIPNNVTKFTVGRKGDFGNSYFIKHHPMNGPRRKSANLSSISYSPNFQFK